MLITLTSPVLSRLRKYRRDKNVLILFIISAGANVTAEEKLKRCVTDLRRSSFPVGFWNIAGAKINPALAYALG